MKPWRKQIALTASAAVADLGLLPIDAPVKVEAVFVFLKPKSVTREFPTVAPDLDKLCRALGDGLTVDANVLVDDSRIVVWDASKIYGDRAGVSVKITFV